MKRLVLSAMVAVGVVVPAASAKLRTIAPPGNSGVQQYLENIPTAAGSRPTNSVHTGGVGGGGAHGGGGSGGGGITPSTLRRLDAQGAAGVEAAALARATAPRNTGPRLREKRHAGARAGAGASPVGTVSDTLAGSTGGGGLGELLPVILLATLLGSAAWAVVRRRGHS